MTEPGAFPLPVLEAPVVQAAPQEHDPEVLQAALQAARDEGYTAGVQDGLRAARAELEPSVEALQQAVQALAAQREALADAIAQDAAMLAVVVAEKVVGIALQQDPELVLEAVKSGLRCLNDREHVMILVNPDDLEIVQSATESMRGLLGADERWELRAERRVARGGALVRTQAGEVDAGVGSRLQLAAECIEAVLRDGA